MLEDIKFQSYCWSLGTTSFRVKDLNFKIERQLQILKELWNENQNVRWNGNNSIQEEYYNKMLQKNFITGEANNKPKDARQKTSGLVQIGVIDDNRHITEIGEKIIDIVEQEDFKSDNIFNINKDSYLYLKQLLKLQITDNGINVKPFAVLLYFLSELGYLTKDEFTYILPLCTNREYIDIMLENIKKYRNNQKTIEDIIQNKMENMSNYKAAIDFIKGNGVNSIDAFLLRAKPVSEGGKGGFYIGRYEAGTETERKSNSEPLTTPLVQANKYPYVYVTRDQAKQKAETMYSGKAEIKGTTQLISSYAWDTALNFICQTSTQGYLLARTNHRWYGNLATFRTTQTGQYKVDGVESDKYSNIYDLLGNCYEFSTEYSGDEGYPCVFRGGSNDSADWAALRSPWYVGR